MTTIRMLPLLLLAILNLHAGDAADADATLDGLFRDYLAAAFRLQPSFAAELGDHARDGRGDDLSAGTRAQVAGLLRDTIDRLDRTVNRERLSPAARVDADILAHDLATSLWLMEEERPFETDPRVWYHHVTDRVYRLFCQSTRPEEERIASALSLMEGIPRILALARQTLREPSPPRTTTAIAQNRGAIAFFTTDLHQLVGHEDARLRSAAVPVIAALEVHQRWLEEELLPRAHGPYRIGAERFRRKLELVLDADLDADRILAAAKERLVSLHHDMALFARQLWAGCYPGDVLPPDDADGRRLLITRVLEAIGRDHGAADDLGREARATVQGLTDFIRTQRIVSLPDPARCLIVDMPAFRRGNAVADLCAAPPLDPEAPSIYSISPPPASWSAERRDGFLSEYNRRALRMLTIHEAFPGHYVQLARNNANPSAIRRIISSGVYQEGWAVYCEQMMLDAGYGDGDPALRLVQLKLQLRAVANAILDQRMHCTGLSDEDAQRFLVEEAFQAPGEAALKVVRAKQGSCQLSTYYAGYLAMSGLRLRVQRELGTRFDCGRFHEALLAAGAVPPRHLYGLVMAALEAPGASLPTPAKPAGM